MKKTAADGLTIRNSASTLNHRHRRTASPAARHTYITVPVRTLPLSAAQDISDPSQHPESDLIASNSGEIARVLLNSLDPADRKLMLDRFASGRSFADLAGDEGVSKTAVHARYRRVLAKLRAALAERGITRIEELF